MNSYAYLHHSGQEILVSSFYQNAINNGYDFHGDNYIDIYHNILLQFSQLPFLEQTFEKFITFTFEYYATNYPDFISFLQNKMAIDIYFFVSSALESIPYDFVLALDTIFDNTDYYEVPGDSSFIDGDSWLERCYLYSINPTWKETQDKFILNYNNIFKDFISCFHESPSSLDNYLTLCEDILSTKYSLLLNGLALNLANNIYNDLYEQAYDKACKEMDPQRYSDIKKDISASKFI